MRLSNSAALPGGTGLIGGTSNLVLDGGVIELASGDFARTAGTLASQVQFTGNGGGFSAVGANRNVNLGGGTAQVTWGSAGFLPARASVDPRLGRRQCDGHFPESDRLASQSGTIQVHAGMAAVDARLSGAISGSGTAGLTKTGDGTLELTANNTYTGATTVSGGALRLSNSGSARRDGAEWWIEQFGSGRRSGRVGRWRFSRGAGTAASQVQFTANGGGFSAVGANRKVNLGGGTAQVTWSGLLPNGGPLILGSVGDDSTVIFQDPIVFDSSAGTVQVNSAWPHRRAARRCAERHRRPDEDRLRVLELTASNNYTGATTVSAGILRLSNSSACPAERPTPVERAILCLTAAWSSLLPATSPGCRHRRQPGAIHGQWRRFWCLYGTRTVNLGGGLAQVAWGSGGFVPAGAALVLGDIAATRWLISRTRSI